MQTTTTCVGLGEKSGDWVAEGLFYSVVSTQSVINAKAVKSKLDCATASYADTHIYSTQMMMMMISGKVEIRLQ